jgi:glycolate oxidase FAD binding subunit
MASSSQVIAPPDTEALMEIVSSATARGTSIQVTGGDTKASIGRPDRQTLRVSMTGFDRIIDYDPSELVLTVGAGATLTSIETLLASDNQMLAFEPYDFALLAGGTAGRSTIGGVVGAGFAGSRRVSAGNVRDHLLGFTAVSGRGEKFVAGGRVVKNVTGYDVSKLMCGSWGQLAILTEMTLKVVPRPRATLTLCATGLEDDSAYRLMTLAMRSQADVAACAYLPSESPGSESTVLLRLEGFGPSVDARAQLLVDLDAGQLERLQGEFADSLWLRVRTAESLRVSPAALWRICVPATRGAQVCAAIRGAGGVMLADWGGALIWASVPNTTKAERVRHMAEQAGGHATLIDAPHDYRSSVSALHPETPAVSALTKRVKAAFDPAGILDPQRFEAGA